MTRLSAQQRMKTDCTCPPASDAGEVTCASWKRTCEQIGGELVSVVLGAIYSLEMNSTDDERRWNEDSLRKTGRLPAFAARRAWSRDFTHTAALARLENLDGIAEDVSRLTGRVVIAYRDIRHRCWAVMLLTTLITAAKLSERSIGRIGVPVSRQFMEEECRAWRNCNRPNRLTIWPQS